MAVIIGLMIGLITGAAQFWMLSQFAKGITGEGIKPRAMVLGILQFFLPFGVLFGCAFLLRSQLLWVGIGIAVILLGGAAVTYVRSRIKRDSGGK